MAAGKTNCIKKLLQAQIRIKRKTGSRSDQLFSGQVTDLQLGELLLHVLLDGDHEVLGGEVHALLHVLKAVDAAGQVLGHVAVVDAVNAGGLQSKAEPGKCNNYVEVAPS